MMSTRFASLLRANGWVLNLVFLACGAYFVAGAANTVVARSIRVVPSIDDTANFASPTAGAAAPQHLLFGSIAERNLLALKRETITPPGQAASASAAPTVVQGRDFKESELQTCSMGATLRATLVADGTPEWSMAIIVSNTTHEPAVYSINEGYNTIADDAVLVDVRSREIIVRRRDHFERCLGEGEVSNAPPAGAPPVLVPQVSGEEPAQPTPGDMTGVTKLSETEYNVERAEVDRVLANLNEVATQARIVPSFKNGKANGFKMFSIKPGSIFSKIGMQNGDVIQKINGYEMNSPDRALEIYGKLRDATSLAIEVQRRGQNMNFSYAIR